MNARQLASAICLAASCVAFAAPALAKGSSPYSRVVVFGDSLSDQGNTESAVAFPPMPLYSMGRYSDNLNWVDILSQQLGVKITNSLAHGTNYAYAFSTTGSQNAPPPLPFKTQTIAQQESLYLASVHGKADSKALYIIEGGATDILGLLFQVETDPLLILFIPTMDLAGVENIESETRALLRAGAQHILIPNVPDLALLPIITEQTGLGKIIAPSVATNAAQIWDSDLAQYILPLSHGGKVTIWDFYNTAALALKGAKQFGITNTTTECVEGYGTMRNAKSKCSAQDVPLYAFFDQVHFTTGGYFGMEQGAYCALGYSTLMGWTQSQCVVTRQSMQTSRDGGPVAPSALTNAYFRGLRVRHPAR